MNYIGVCKGYFNILNQKCWSEIQFGSRVEPTRQAQSSRTPTFLSAAGDESQGLEMC